MLAISTGILRRTTKFPQRSPAAEPLRARLPNTRSPAKPTMAGNNVSAMSTAMATVAAAARPISVRNGMPTTESPASAITTVRPANTTADPAVPTARPAASSGSPPTCSSCR
jgi:hypothetical protein